MSDVTEEYLESVLASQSLEDGGDELKALDREFERIRLLVSEHFPDDRPEVVVGGSRAKGTLIRTSYDLDVICYFGQGDDAADGTLEEIYEAVRDALKADYNTRRRRSAVRLTSPKEDRELLFTVDVVPGRYVDAARADVFLHQTEGDKPRLKTNFGKHISHVRESGCLDMIRLAKLWRVKTGIDVKTFVLELLVIDVLGEDKPAGLADQLVLLWSKLRDDIDDLKVQDPANPSGNDLSDIFDDDTKEALSAGAAVALDLAEAGDWEAIFGAEGEGSEAASRTLQPSAVLALDDTSHAKAPPWPGAPGRYRAELSAFRRRSSKKWRPFGDNGSACVEGTELRFQVETSVPGPYEVKWQVVNTGEHARDDWGLRGDEFFRGHTPAGFATDDEHINFENCKYTGKHWIECFIVKDGRLWARTGRFHVNIVNRRRGGFRRWLRRLAG